MTSHFSIFSLISSLTAVSPSVRLTDSTYPTRPPSFYLVSWSFLSFSSIGTRRDVEMQPRKYSMVQCAKMCSFLNLHHWAEGRGLPYHIQGVPQLGDTKVHWTLEKINS